MQKLLTSGPGSQLPKTFLYANLGLYAAYTLSSGPLKLKYEKYLTMQSGSLPTALIFSHFCNTNPFATLFNCGVLGTIGMNIAQCHGASTFLKVVALSIGASTLLSLAQMRHDSSKSYSGGAGISAGLITYTAFANPQLLAIRGFPLPPTAYFAAALFYGLYSNNSAVIGGVGAGYAAFLLVL